MFEFVFVYILWLLCISCNFDSLILNYDVLDYVCRHFIKRHAGILNFGADDGMTGRSLHLQSQGTGEVPQTPL